MTEFDENKLREVVLYILNATKGIDYYRVFKILYFAEREHLKQYGTRIVADDFKALPYGPVPTNLYKAIQDKSYSNIIEIGKEDAAVILLPKRLSNLDYLSKSDIECLDNSIRENARLTFDELKNKSHDLAWTRKAIRCGTISPMDMAEAVNASDSMLAYISEQIELDCALL